MKTAILATLIAGTAAFAPAQTGKATTALNGAFDNEIGAASAELGCWDPLGFVTNGDQARFDRLRGIELKHGRIAMLATWGYATTWSGARFPGCEDVAAGHGKFFQVYFICHDFLFALWYLKTYTHAILYKQNKHQKQNRGCIQWT